MKNNPFISEFTRIMTIDNRTEQIREALTIYDKALQGDTLSCCIIACFIGELDPETAAAMFDEVE